VTVVLGLLLIAFALSIWVAPTWRKRLAEFTSGRGTWTQSPEADARQEVVLRVVAGIALLMGVVILLRRLLT
jgi:hypothetical protein